MNLKHWLGEDKRTALMRKNIALSFLIKGWSGLVTFILVRATLECIGEYKNDIWLTISSMLVWIENFDIGLGNGLRNQLASYLASGDLKSARESVSSTFFMLILIMVPSALLLILATYHLDLYKLLNVNREIVNDLTTVVTVAIVMVSTTFIFKFVGNVYMGLQLPAVSNLLVTLGQTLQLFCILFLHYTSHGTLYAVVLASTLSSLVIYLMAYIVTFDFRYKHLKPQLSGFTLSRAKSLFSIGVIFFLLQISSMLVTMSTNFIISHYLSPAQVVPFNISWRYFTIAQLLFSVVCSPYWSATTDAYASKDIQWIRKSGKQMERIILLTLLLIVIMIPLSHWIYPLLTGNIVEMPLSVTLCMALYMSILIYSMAYCYFLNGMGILRIQLICTLGAAIVYLPIVFLILRYTNNIIWILLTMSLVNLPSMICNRIQFEKVVRGSAKGIWKK